MSRNFFRLQPLTLLNAKPMVSNVSNACLKNHVQIANIGPFIHATLPYDQWLTAWPCTTMT